MKVLRFSGSDGNRTVFTLTNFSVDQPTKQFGQTPLHVATFAGNPECVKWLLHCGAHKDKADYLGETSLHKAARTGTLACAKLLAAHAAAYGIRNNNGQLPMDLARACGHPSVAEYLRQVEEATTPKTATPHAENHAMEEADEDAMESGDSAPDCATPLPVTKPGNDVLSDGAVAANIVPIGGRKRSRNYRDDVAPKRCRFDDSGSDSNQIPNLSFLFKESEGDATGLVASPTDNNAISATMAPMASCISQPPSDVPNPAHFEGRPLFYSPVASTRLGSANETGGVDNSMAMEDDEMMADAVGDGVKPRSSASCPGLHDRYPGSLEFGHRGVATANPPRDGATAAIIAKSHCFLSSSNHYNNNSNSPVHRNRTVTTPSSSWSEHCSSVLQEQDYCANYSQLMGDEMFQNIHGC